LEAMAQWFQEVLLEQGHSLVRQRMWEQGLLEQNQKRHQATGSHAQRIGKRSHARQSKTGLDETFGMGNMKGASEGIEFTLHFV